MPAVRYWLIRRHDEWTFMADAPPEAAMRRLLIRKSAFYLQQLMMPDCIRFTNPEDYEVQIDHFSESLLRVKQRHYYWFESRHGQIESFHHILI